MDTDSGAEGGARSAMSLFRIATIPLAAAALLSAALLLPTNALARSDAARAATASLNVASDRSALNAYAAFLTELIADAPAGQADDSTYIDGISAQCKSALQPLTQPGVQLGPDAQHTLTVLGREMGDDLAINFNQASLPAFTKLASTLQRLRWTRVSGGGGIVRRFVNTRAALYDMAGSDLCQDALYASQAPALVPAGTRAFMRAYAKASTSAATALSDLLNLMHTYEVSGEKSLVSRIGTLTAQNASITKTDLLQSGTQLSTTLETT